MPDRPVTACLIVIGNEILSGRTQDANLAYLGARLNDIGVRLMEARVIPDIEEVIVETVNEARRRFSYVFTTGGIGPTHDDITAASIAKAFGVPLVQNPEARAILEAYYPAQAMFEGLAHRLVGGKPLLSRSVTVYLPESKLAPDFEALQGRYPDVEMGSYPFSRSGRFGARLVLRATEEARLAAAEAELETALRELGGEPAWD